MLHISPEGGYRVVTRQFSPDDYNLSRPKQVIEMEMSTPPNGEPPMPVTEQIITQLDGVEYVAPEGYQSYTDYIADFGKTHCKLPEPPVPEYSFRGRKSGILGGHDWLHLSSDFNFLENPFETNEFLYRAFDMFREPTDDPAQYYEKYAEFGKQTYLAAEELRQQIADGKGDSLFTLKTTFDLGGMKLTVGDLIHLHEGMNQTVAMVDSWGDVRGFSMIGMSVSAFKQFAKENFSAEIQDQMVSYVEHRVQLDLLDNQSGTYDYFGDYHLTKENTESLNAMAYQKFSTIDLNDQQAFDEAVDWCLGEIKEWCRIASCRYDEPYNRNMLYNFREKYL